MKEFIKFMDELPLILKIIFAIPAIDIVWNVYRFIKSYEKKNTLGMVLSVVIVLLFSWNVIAIFDIVMIALQGKIWWID